MVYDKEILRKLRDLGFKRMSRWTELVEYIRYLDDRKLTVQLWADGHNRVNYAKCGPKGQYCRETTTPTEFGNNVVEMMEAIRYEQTRS